MSQFFTYNACKGQLLLGLKVKANAKRNAVEKFIETDNRFYLKLSTAQTPENGRANEAIVDFLSKEWGISKCHFSIVTGFTNNFKVLAIKNISMEYLNDILCKYS